MPLTRDQEKKKLNTSLIITSSLLRVLN